MALVELAGALLLGVVAIGKRPQRVGGDEQVVVGRTLVQVARVGPGVGHVALHPLAGAAAELDHQAVIPEPAAVFELVDALVLRVHAVGRQIHGGRIRAHVLAVRVLDGVGDRLGGRADVQVARHEELDAAAGDVGHGDAHRARDFALDAEVPHLRVRRGQPRVGEAHAGGARREVGAVACEIVREHGAGGELRRVGVLQRDGPLLDAVALEQVAEQRPRHARIEDAVARAHDGLRALVQGQGEADARGEVLLRLADAARLRIVRVDDVGLEELGVFIPHAVVQRQPAGHLELVLREEVPVADEEVDLRPAEGLLVALPALAAVEVGQVLRKGGEGGVGVGAAAVVQQVDNVLRVREVNAELRRVAAFEPRQVVDELEAVLGGLHARQEGGHAEVALALHAELAEKPVWRGELRVDRVVQAVLHVAEPRFIDQRGRQQPGVGEAREARADARVAVVAHAGAGVQRGLGLDAVGREPVHHVAAEGERVALIGAPVELAEHGVLVGVALHLPEEALEVVDGVLALLGRGRSAAGPDELPGGGEQLRVGHRAGQREVAAGDFAVKEVEQLVAPDGAADGAARLVAPLGRVEGGVAVARVEVLVAEEPEPGAMHLVGAALGDGVDDAADGAAEFGREARALHLELLHGVLADVGADARAAGVFVVVALRGVVAVGEKRVAAGHAAEGDQAEGAVFRDAGRQQHEAVHAAAIDRQVHDVAVLDHLRDAGLELVDHRSRVRHGDLLHLRLHVENDVQRHVLAHQHLDLLRFPGGEAGLAHRDLIARGRRQRRRREQARFIGFQIAPDAERRVADHHRRAGNHGASCIPNRSVDCAQTGQRLRVRRRRPEADQTANQIDCLLEQAETPRSGVNTSISHHPLKGG